MLKTLHGRLSLALLALLFAVGLLYISLTLYTARNYMDEVNQNLNRALASDLAKHLVEKNLLRTDPAVRPQAEAEIKQNMVLNPDIEIYILDPDGKILDYSGAPGAVQRQRVALEPIQRFIAALGPLPIRGDDPRHPGRQKIFSASRIPPDSGGKTTDRLKGYIYIILGGEKYDAVAALPERSYILRLSTWSMAASLSLMAIAGVLLFGLLTQRLRRLIRGVEAFQASGGITPLRYAKLPHDEIARLELACAQMSQRIAAQTEQRAATEAQRRESVSNISHDLRTPLATLQGYLETILMKEGTLAPAEQRHYLMTAIKHAERLGKLITSLFELSQLDSLDRQPALESFSLAELVQDVVQQRQLTAQQKGVKLEAQYANDLPFAYADIGLVERALENLLQNALRHTPSGGEVRIVLMRSGERLCVEVRDSGSGIQTEDLPHIFERSFRASSKNMVDESLASEGAGLGLAITRRIVELHGGEIRAHSVPSEGATFTFDLPLFETRA